MTLIENSASPQDIKLTSTIKVEVIEDHEAKVVIPEELRLSTGLLKLINDSLASQGLTLQHMDIAEAHKEDLRGLPNVVLNEEEKEE